MSGPLQKAFMILRDPRIIVGWAGVTLSVVLHEAFHVIIHLSEIQSFSIFPDHNALVTIFFVPSTNDFDLAFEEATAYLITIITLVLTVMLINDIREVRDKRSVRQILSGNTYSSAQGSGSEDRLARLLGIRTEKKKTPSRTRKKTR